MEFAQALLGHVWTVTVFLIVITVLVAVHELGHYLAARWFGMEVKAFAVMMGGIRKTDLRDHLKVEMAPSVTVWTAGLMSFVVLLVGFALSSQELTIVGFSLLTFVMPAWVALRLEHLYHLPKFKALKRLGLWISGGLVALWLGTKGQGMNLELVFGVLLAASILAVLTLYYIPVSQKDEESEMGEGKIMVGDESVHVQFRPIWARTNNEGTEFSLLVIPAGGFAAIKGMTAYEDGSEVNIDKGFYSKGPIPRLAVLFAGPLFSIVFGVILAAGVYKAQGVPEVSHEPVLGTVAQGEGGMAYEAGLREGDRIISVDGNAVNEFYDLILGVREKFTENADGTLAPVPVDVVYQRGDEQQTATVTPLVLSEEFPVLDRNMEPTDEDAIQAKIGVSPVFEMVPISMGAAVTRAVSLPFQLVGSLGKMVIKPETVKRNVGGPATMARISSAAAKSGILSVLLMAGVLSISLGVLNLLPIPPMDGGQMLIAFVELFRGGRRLSFQVQNSVITAGMFLLIALMLGTILMDIQREATSNKTQEEIAQQTQDDPNGEPEGEN